MPDDTNDQQKINEYNSLVSDYKRLVGIKKKLNEEYEYLVDEGYDIQYEMKEAACSLGRLLFCVNITKCYGNLK